MAALPPHITAVLAQVESEINAILSAGETGTVIVHCGPNDIAVEINRKRKREPVRIDRQVVTIDR